MRDGRPADVVWYRDLPAHVFDHILTMARLHAATRYDRLAHDVDLFRQKGPD
jgi:hypothetical protein